MKKHELEQWLRNQLSDLPKGEVDGILIFYTSAIEDRMEDGMTEEEAVQALGDPNAILAEIRASRPMTYSPSRPPKRKKRVLWAAGILLVVLGAVFGVYSLGRWVFGWQTDRSHQPSVAEPDESFGDSSVYEEDALYPGEGDFLKELIGSDVVQVQDGEYFRYLIPGAYIHAIYLCESTGSIQVEAWSDPYVQIQLLYPDEYSIELNEDGYFWVSRLNEFPHHSYESPTILLQLPETLYADLQVEIDTGSFKLSGLLLEQLFVSIDTGSINIQHTSANEMIQLETDTGSISLDTVNCDNALVAKTDTGSIQLKEVDSGDSLAFTTDTGAISGTLAGPFSRYCVDTHVDTGKSNLPATSGVGPIPVYVEANTGTIRLEFSGESMRTQEESTIQTVVAEAIITDGPQQERTVTLWKVPKAPDCPEPPEAPSLSDWFLGLRLNRLLPWNW